MTLGDAINLGDIGSTTRSVSGFIDPRALKLRSPCTGSRCRRGIPGSWTPRSSRRRSAAPCRPRWPSSTATATCWPRAHPGQGPDSDQAGPLIVQDLAPGTYYLGISASGNLPGWTGGYDLKAGTPGTAGFDEADGAFLLDAIATPLPSSTTLTSGSLDYEDPLETSPTGLDLTFSGPIDRSLFQPDQQETALEVVERLGEVWPMTAMNYQTSTNTLSFIFDEPLPAGSYSLIDPAQGGLTDAVGQPIVVPAGNPSGVLGELDRRARHDAERSRQPGRRLARPGQSDLGLGDRADHRALPRPGGRLPVRRDLPRALYRANPVERRSDRPRGHGSGRDDRVRQVRPHRTESVAGLSGRRRVLVADDLRRGQRDCGSVDPPSAARRTGIRSP